MKPTLCHTALSDNEMYALPTCVTAKAIIHRTGRRKGLGDILGFVIVIVIDRHRHRIATARHPVARSRVACAGSPHAHADAGARAMNLCLALQCPPRIPSPPLFGRPLRMRMRASCLNHPNFASSRAKIVVSVYEFLTLLHF